MHVRKKKSKKLLLLLSSHLPSFNKSRLADNKNLSNNQNDPANIIPLPEEEEKV
jgi:hypothetical protein